MMTVEGGEGHMVDAHTPDIVTKGSSYLKGLSTINQSVYLQYSCKQLRLILCMKALYLALLLLSKVLCIEKIQHELNALDCHIPKI